jgi:putative MATE family efflux protein
LEKTVERWNNRALFGLIWPIMIEQILIVTLGALDTLMVSHAGEHAIAGVNIIDNINNLMIIAFAALCTGGAVVVSQYIGRREYENSSHAAKQLIYSVVFISVIIMVIAVIFHRPIIHLIYGNIEDDVMGAAAVYFVITALSYPFLAVFNANAALFRATGNSRTPMLIMVLINIIKIGGNILLIFVLNLGVFGAALTTLLCRIIAAAITTRMLYRNNYSPISLSGLFNIKIEKDMIKNILNVGIPSGLESSMFQIGRLMTQRIFTFFGTAAIAANAIASMINSLSFMAGTAFGLTMITIVGQCVGAGDYTEAKRQTFKIMKISYTTMLIISTLIFIFMGHLISIFNMSDEAQNMAKSFLRIHCFSQALTWSMAFALPNALRAAGDVRYVMIAATISMWAVRVSMAYLFAFALGLGPIGVWLAMAADFILRGIFYFTRWKGGKWQDKKVITH